MWFVTILSHHTLTRTRGTIKLGGYKGCKGVCKGAGHDPTPPQVGHGGVWRQPCRPRLLAGRSLSSAALSWSDDDVYRLARALASWHRACFLVSSTLSGSVVDFLDQRHREQHDGSWSSRESKMTRLTPHTQLSSKLVLYGQAPRRIKVCLQHPLADRLAQVAPAAAGTAALPLILLP